MANDRRQASQPHLAAFGRRVADLRHQQGLSQEALAERCGLAASVLSEIENARRDVRLSALWLLAGALNVPVTDLLTDLHVTRGGPPDR